MDKAKLIHRAKEGNPAALAEIYARFQPAGVLLYTRSIVHNIIAINANRQFTDFCGVVTEEFQQLVVIVIHAAGIAVTFKAIA